MATTYTDTGSLTGEQAALKSAISILEENNRGGLDAAIDDLRDRLEAEPSAAYQEVQKRATELRKSDSKLSQEAAEVEVVKRDPELQRALQASGGN